MFRAIVKILIVASISFGLTLDVLIWAESRLVAEHIQTILSMMGFAWSWFIIATLLYFGLESAFGSDEDDAE